MSFQAYLDNIEQQTGKTPQELINDAGVRGIDSSLKSSEIAEWFKREYGLGHGHAMAMAHVIKRGVTINETFVGGDSVHRDESNKLRLDGIDNR